jgi:hypothetical protein
MLLHKFQGEIGVAVGDARVRFVYVVLRGKAFGLRIAAVPVSYVLLRYRL